MPKPIRNILVPSDFSEASDVAIRYADEMARTLDAKLTLMHANLPPMYARPDGGFVPVPPTPDEITRYGQQHLEEQAARLGVSGFETLSVDGPPADTIAQVACERGFDLVVMGTHGRTGFKRLVLGSVAERVVRLSPVPVLTVR